MLSVEDLVARTTALVCGRLRRGQSVDVRHATAFTRLFGLGRPEQLAAAWNDHRQQVPGTLDAASREAARLLQVHPELAIVEKYSSDASPCDRCREHGPFRSAPSGRIVEILGYCQLKRVERRHFNDLVYDCGDRTHGLYLRMGRDM